MSPDRRRKMVDWEHPKLSMVRQRALLGVSRSSLYYRAKGASEEVLSLMRDMNRQYLETPFYGSRRMRAWLDLQGMPVSRKWVQRSMRVMGLRAIYRRPRTSQPALEHRVYPYLLRNARVTRPNQVWAADITYLPMARGFLYLVVVMDWHSRYVVAWRLSIFPHVPAKLRFFAPFEWRGRQGSRLPIHALPTFPGPHARPGVCVPHAHAVVWRESYPLLLTLVGPGSLRQHHIHAAGNGQR